MSTFVSIGTDQVTNGTIQARGKRHTRSSNRFLDETPDVGERVVWKWQTDQDDRWYGGKVSKVSASAVTVLYDDGTSFLHARGELRERHHWCYSFLEPTNVQKRPLDRGSGSRGERGGVDFDPYERDEDDGVFYGTLTRRFDRVDEERYAARRKREKRRAAADPRRQGYEDDGFVVLDGCITPSLKTPQTPY